MKILCVTPWFPRHINDQNGNFILDSILSLKEENHEVIVLVTEPWRPSIAKYIRKKWKNTPIDFKQFTNKFCLHIKKYISIPNNYFWQYSYWSYKRNIIPTIHYLIKKYNIDLVHAHTEIAGMAISHLNKTIPKVVSLHGISSDKRLYKGKQRSVLFEHMLSNMNRVVLVGKPLHYFFKQFVKDDSHFRIVNNGFRGKNSQFLSKIINRHFINLISVSNLQVEKGIHINLYVLGKLKAIGFNNWEYKIIGDGNERKNLEKLTADLMLHNNVKFVGACHHDDVYRHLIQSDVFILPSYQEAFGIAYLEAMAFGLLTIGVKGQGPETFINHGVTGFLVNPHDQQDLFYLLKYIFEHPEKLDVISKAGQQHVLTHYTWKKHAAALLNVFNEVVSYSA